MIGLVLVSALSAFALWGMWRIARDVKRMDDAEREGRQ